MLKRESTTLLFSWLSLLVVMPLNAQDVSVRRELIQQAIQRHDSSLTGADDNSEVPRFGLATQWEIIGTLAAVGDTKKLITELKKVSPKNLDDAYSDAVVELIKYGHVGAARKLFSNMDLCDAKLFLAQKIAFVAAQPQLQDDKLFEFVETEVRRQPQQELTLRIGQDSDASPRGDRVFDDSFKKTMLEKLRFYNALGFLYWGDTDAAEEVGALLSNPGLRQRFSWNLAMEHIHQGDYSRGIRIAEDLSELEKLTARLNVLLRLDEREHDSDFAKEQFRKSCELAFSIENFKAEIDAIADRKSAKRDLYEIPEWPLAVTDSRDSELAFDEDAIIKSLVQFGGNDSEVIEHLISQLSEIRAEAFQKRLAAYYIDSLLKRQQTNEAIKEKQRLEEMLGFSVLNSRMFKERALFAFASGGQFVEAKALLSSIPKDSQRRLEFVIGAFEYNKGRVEQSKQTLSSFIESFQSQFQDENESPNLKFRRLVDQTAIMGWNGRIQVGRLPLEQEIFGVFESVRERIDGLEAKEHIESYLGSFTPVTPPTKKILIEILKRLGYEYEPPLTFRDQARQQDAFKKKIRLAPENDVLSELNKCKELFRTTAIPLPANSEPTNQLRMLAVELSRRGLKQPMTEALGLLDEQSFIETACSCARVWPPALKPLYRLDLGRSFLPTTGGGFF